MISHIQNQIRSLALVIANLLLLISPREALTADEVIVQLQPVYLEGCTVSSGSIRLSDRLRAQEEGKSIVIEGENASRIVFQKKKTQTVTEDTPEGKRTIKKPWEPQAEKGASNGKYIDWVENAEFKFLVLKPGRYIRWMRYAVPGPSFFHKESIDSEAPFWDLEEVGDVPKLAWQWKPCEVRYQAPRKRVYYDLERGEHSLKLHTFYNGARLDKILFTTDPEYRPEGVGPPETPEIVPAKGMVELSSLKLPGSRAWGRLLSVIEKNGGDVRLEFSVDGGKTFAPIAADGRLPALKTSETPQMPLRLRALLTRSQDGKSPVLKNPRVVFTPNPERIVTLSNDKVVIRFDRKNGKLLGLENRKHGAVSQLWIPSSLFTVSLKRPNDPDIRVLAHDDAVLKDVTEEKTANGAKTVFEYSLAGGQIRLNLTFALSGDEELRCSASIANRMEETDVIRLKFPILEGIRLGEKSEDDVLVVPQHAGRIVKNPSKAGIVSLKYQGSASMCWEDLSDAEAGVYLAAYDPELRNTAIECRPSKTSGRVDMWLEKAHRIRARFGRTQYDYSVAIHEGDWHRGADLYRRWFYENMGRAEHPDWLRNADGWLAFMIMNSAAPFRTLPKWYDIGRWHGMNFLQCWGQANKPVGNCCPTYYYPSPFFGTVEEFAAANKAVRDAGGHIGYYFHSQSLNRFNLSMPWIHTEIDRKLIPRYLQPPTYDFFFRNALVGPDGKMPGPPNYKAFWQRKNAGKHANDFPGIVPWSDEWQNYIEFWAVWQYAAQWHADTFYFDVMGVSHSKESFNPMRDENGEGLTGQGMLNLVRNVLTKSKPYAPEAVASGEGCADSYGRIGFHMVSGFAKSPEVFRYTLPDQILYHGHLNTGHATPRAVFEKDHLYGMRYDLLMRGSYPRELIFLRKRFKSWLYPARYMDEEGLKVGGVAVQAKLHLLDTDEAKGCLVTILNPGGEEGLQGSVSHSILSGAKHALTFRMWNDPMPATFQNSEDAVTFKIPKARVSAVLLVERATGSRSVHATARFHREPKGAGISITVVNLSGKETTSKVSILDDDGLGLSKEPVTLATVPGKTTHHFVDLGPPNQMHLRKYVKVSVRTGEHSKEFEVPVGPILLKDGTFESQPAGDKSRSMFIDDSDAATGKQSLCLHNPVGGHLADASFLDVKPSTRYRISMKIKRTAIHSIYAMLWMARADARQRGMKTLGGYAGKLNEWQEFSQEFETPEDLYALRLYSYNRLKNAKAWYDDILVEELGPAKVNAD